MKICLKFVFFLSIIFVQFLVALQLANRAPRHSKMLQNRSKTKSWRTKFPKWTSLPSSKKWSKMTLLASQNDPKSLARLIFSDAESSIRITYIFECNNHVTCLLCWFACLFACLLACLLALLLACLSCQLASS